MIFARYIGVDKQFTAGKVYPAKPEVDSGGVAGFGFLELENDAGEPVQVKPHVNMVDQPDGKAIWADRYDFEFLEEVYAVVVKPFDDLKSGQVVVVDEAEFFEVGNKWSRLVYSIKGLGYRSSEWLVLLDRTNVFPGIVLQDESTGNWVKVSTVDESLWVVTENNALRRSPEEFRFSIDMDGDIQVEPYLECTDDSGKMGLTQGKFYRILRTEYQDDDARRLYVVSNDDGEEVGYLVSRFRV